MLDKNGLPIQFPPSAFSAFPGFHPGFDPRMGSPGWPPHPAFSAAAAAAAAQQSPAGLPVTSVGATGFTQPSADSIFSHPALSPNFLTSPGASLRHQDYLNAAAQRLSEMQASAALDPLNAIEASRRASRKRAISASPYSEMDLSTLIRYSPTALHLLNGGSPTSSGSYGHLSPGGLSPFHSAHLQQLQAHLIRSASSSPFLSPQNSLQASLLHSSAAAAAAVSAAMTSTNPYFPFLNPAAAAPCDSPKTEAKDSSAKAQLETCSNVVSSTMEDDDSSSREGLTPLTSVKHEPRDFNEKRLDSASTTSMMIKEEPDFVETHCHWTGCDRDLHTQDQLVKHLNNDHIGNSKKAFVCQWKDCSREEKPFKAQYMLVVHMRRHTGEKPHRCTFENCAKAYSRLENLKTHLRSHTGEKPYTCEFPGCSKAFSNASDRAKHQNRTHSNEKPYACKAPGCTKRYTDPSSLRKHVKTVHGHEFYASKRHKGNHFDGSRGSMDDNNPNTPKTPHSVSTVKSEVESSPGPISPSDERHNMSSGSGNSSAAGGVMANNNMPLSDNNVSTSNLAINHWDMVADPEQDINMAVAAAIGVGSEESSSMGMPAGGGSNNALAQRLSNKMKMMPNHLGEINRSIEKMSIHGTNYPVSGVMGQQHQQHCSAMPMGQTQLQAPQGNRRGSNWTNSTEGYGSMRSEQSMMSSRRCSDVSAMSQGSNVSTRAMMNSPWDHMSADSSRRSSMASNHGGVASNDHPGHASSNQGIGQHLNRLHRRATQHHQMMQGAPPTSTPVATPTPMMDGRGSAMSAVTPTNPPIMPPVPPVAQHNGHSGARRASDPVRTLDRTFGVDGQLSRHQRSGSYNQLNMAAQQNRVPMHGQRIRGMSGDTYFHPQQQQNDQQQMQQQQQNMYQNRMPGQYNQQQQQQNGQFYHYNQGGNNWQQQNYPAPGNFPGYAPTAASGRSAADNGSFEYNNQWQANNWAGWNGMSNGNPSEQQKQVSGSTPNCDNSSAAAATVAPANNSATSYQRTFDYVQQCQNWTAQ